MRKASNSRIFLSESPRERLNTFCNSLELIFLLASNLVYVDTVIIAIAPLDLHRVEVDLNVCAIDVLLRARRETAESTNEVEQFLYVVARSC